MPVRMAAIKKSTNNKCCRGCLEKETLLHCGWEYKLVQPRWRTVWRFLKKLEIDCHMTQQSHCWQRHVYPNVHCNAIYNSQDMEAT